MKQRVVVLMAVYNGKKYIQEQIESIFLQIDVSPTLYISLDDSIDQTRELLEYLYKENLEVVILKDVGHFGGAAKNFFRLIQDVDFSTFDYVAFADQDDIWYHDKLTRAVQKLKETGSDGYSSDVLAFWKDGRQKQIIKSQAQCQYDFLFEAAGPGCTYVMNQSLALQIQNEVRQKYEEVGKLWLHDWFCYAYARANGFQWFIDKRPSMLYRQHENNQVGVNTGWKAFWVRIKKVLLGGAIKQSRQIAILVGMQENDFVKQWAKMRKIDLVKLAFYAPHCRRKKIEKVYFFIACLVMAIVYREPK